jgi:hypothetical protein
MRPISIVVEELIFRFKMKRVAKVEGYDELKLVKQQGNNLIVTREKGKETEIPKSRILKAIEVVRKDPTIYDRGPGALHGSTGVTHITPPVWTILHLMTLEELLS